MRIDPYKIGIWLLGVLLLAVMVWCIKGCNDKPVVTQRRVETVVRESTGKTDTTRMPVVIRGKSVRPKAPVVTVNDIRDSVKVNIIITDIAESLKINYEFDYQQLNMHRTDTIKISTTDTQVATGGLSEYVIYGGFGVVIILLLILLARI